LGKISGFYIFLDFDLSKSVLKISVVYKKIKENKIKSLFRKNHESTIFFSFIFFSFIFFPLFFIIKQKT